MRRIGLAILLSVSFLSVPLITEGQQTGSPRRVGFLLVGLIPESSEAQHFALLPCLEDFVRTAHALADLDAEAWPAWWPKDWPESQLEGPRKETH
jgi:hypothetical protein